MRRSPEMSMEGTEQSAASKPYMEYGELTLEEQARARELDEQFKTPQFAEIPIPESEGKSMRVEYVILDSRSDAERSGAVERGDRTVVVVPGYGASYRSPGHLAKLLALREKKRVIVVSLPSTGQTDNPPMKWFGEKDFHLYGEVVGSTLENIRAQEREIGSESTTGKVSVVGPSMGALVASEYASRHPDNVSDLVLVHPAGIREGLGQLVKGSLREGYSSKKQTKEMNDTSAELLHEQRQAYNAMWGDTLKLRLIKQLAGSEYEQMMAATPGGTLHEKVHSLWDDQMEHLAQELGRDTLQQSYTLYRRDVQGEYTDMPEEIILGDVDQQYGLAHKVIEKEFKGDSVNSYKRGLLQRLWEVKTMAQGGLTEKLKHVNANVHVIMSSRDMMFPSEQLQDLHAGLETNGKVFSSTVLQTKHDDIQRDARLYASQIGGFLDKQRAREETGHV